MNSKQLGNIALANAMAYFAEQGNGIFIPIGDNGGDIDLIVTSDDGTTARIQCKYTSRTRGNDHDGPETRAHSYIVDLRQSVPSKEGWSKSIIKYTSDAFDLLFITTPECNYLIPWRDLCENGESPGSFTLSVSYERYRV